MMTWWNNSLTHGGMGSMMWLGLLWIVLLIAVVYLSVKLFSDKADHQSKKETTLEILQKEFAKGNISEEEYLKRKKQLE